MFRFTTKISFFVLSLFLLTACQSEKKQIALTGSTMGTYYSIKYLAQDNIPSKEQIQKEIDAVLEQVNNQMSTYRKNSELSQFNQSRGEEPFPVSSATATVVKEAIRLNKITEGALDITVGPLVNLWGFGPGDRPEQIPSKADLAQAYQRVGIQYLAVDGNKLIKKIPNLYVDLSSIAKGYGVDAVAHYFDKKKITNYLVDIGGELHLKGVNVHNKPWRVAVEKPTPGEQKTVQLILQPGDMAVATSGDYRNYFEEDGIRYSHTINPKTGLPITNHLVSVTVIDKSCMTADGIATGLDVLGPEKALEVANQHNIATYMIEKTADGYKEIISEAFKPYLER